MMQESYYRNNYMLAVRGVTIAPRNTAALLLFARELTSRGRSEDFPGGLPPAHQRSAHVVDRLVRKRKGCGVVPALAGGRRKRSRIRRQS